MSRSWLLVAVTSVLMGCHPQGAVPAMPGTPPPLEQEVLESSIKPWLDSLSVCLEDMDVVPGQQPKAQKAKMQLSINDNGQVQSVAVQVDDADVTECISRKANDWVFPRGRFTSADVDLRLEAKTAGLAAVHILPATRTAASR